MRASAKRQDHGRKPTRNTSRAWLDDWMAAYRDAEQKELTITAEAEQV